MSIKVSFEYESGYKELYDANYESYQDAFESIPYYFECSDVMHGDIKTVTVFDQDHPRNPVYDIKQV